MKTYVLIIIGLALSFNTIAQKKGGERLKTLRIAFITKEIDLTSKQAEQFWPIFNEGQERSDQIRKEINALDKNSFELSEDEASKRVDAFFTLEQEYLQSRLETVRKLRPVISSLQIISLIRAKEKFKKEMLNQFKHNRKRRMGKGKR